MVLNDLEKKVRAEQVVSEEFDLAAGALQEHLSKPAEARLSTGYVNAIDDARPLDLAGIFEAVYHHIGQLMDARFFYVGLYNAPTSQLTLTKVYDDGAPLPDKTFTIDPNTGITGWVIYNRQSLIIHDAEHDAMPNALLRYGTPARSALFIPLIAQDEILGVISVQSPAPDAFTAHDVTLLEAIAGSIAIAIRSSQLAGVAQRYARELTTAHTELQGLDQLRQELVQNLIHELRSPLAFVRGYVSLLAAEELGPISDEQAEALSVIDRKTDAMLRLIDDIQDMERISRSTLRRQPENLTAILKQAVEGAELAFAGKSIAFALQLPATAIELSIDALRITQVLDNLLANAVKYSKAGDTISIRCEQEGSWVRVDVSDQGRGIPAENLGRLFERFYQVPGTSKPGSGLGLAIVQQIIEAHEGKVQVTSVVGKGSTFSFYLPY